VNPEMVPEFEKAGLSFVGRDESGTRMEVKLTELFCY
jgi:CTP synthase